MQARDARREQPAQGRPAAAARVRVALGEVRAVDRRALGEDEEEGRQRVLGGSMARENASLLTVCSTLSGPEFTTQYFIYYGTSVRTVLYEIKIPGLGSLQSSRASALWSVRCAVLVF